MYISINCPFYYYIARLIYIKNVRSTAIIDGDLIFYADSSLLCASILYLFCRLVCYSGKKRHIVILIDTFISRIKIWFVYVKISMIYAHLIYRYFVHCMVWKKTKIYICIVYANIGFFFLLFFDGHRTMNLTSVLLLTLLVVHS